MCTAQKKKFKEIFYTNNRRENENFENKTQ